MFVSRPDWQLTFQAFTRSDPGSAKIRDTMDFESSTLVSCLAHVTSLFARTASSMSQRHFLSLCLWDPVAATEQIDCCDSHDILSLSEFSCDKHHVCAYSRRAHIQPCGEDLSGRQFTARCKVLPRRLCSKLCNIITSREIGNGCLHLLLF